MLAVESELITADVIEVSEFPEIAERYQIYAVPKVVFNDQIAFEGARPEAFFIAAIEEVTRENDVGNGNGPDESAV